MKSILIPTTFEADTINAVKAAINRSSGTNCTITLLSLKESFETYSAGYTLQDMSSYYTPAQDEVAGKCRQHAALAPNCRLTIRNQYGISGPLLKNLLEFLGTDLIIIPQSYRNEKSKIHSYFLGLLQKCRKPILHMGTEDVHDLTNALYIEYKTGQTDLQNLQQMVNGQFNLKIVSSAKLDDGQTVKAIEEDIRAAVNKNNVDVLIETRKPVKQKISDTVVNESLGLPVLSIYEESVNAGV